VGEEGVIEGRSRGWRMKRKGVRRGSQKRMHLTRGLVSGSMLAAVFSI
jgi:hypothetical protein